MHVRDLHEVRDFATNSPAFFGFPLSFFPRISWDFSSSFAEEISQVPRLPIFDLKTFIKAIKGVFTLYYPLQHELTEHTVWMLWMLWMLWVQMKQILKQQQQQQQQQQQLN